MLQMNKPYFHSRWRIEIHDLLCEKRVGRPSTDPASVEARLSSYRRATYCRPSTDPASVEATTA